MIFLKEVHANNVENAIAELQIKGAIIKNIQMAMDGVSNGYGGINRGFILS